MGGERCVVVVSGGQWTAIGSSGRWLVESLLLINTCEYTRFNFVTSGLSTTVCAVLSSVEATVRAAHYFPPLLFECYHHFLFLTEGLMGVESGSEGSDEA